MQVLRAFLVLIARLSISAIFIISGVSKFMFYDMTSQYMASQGLTAVPLFLVLAALLEIIAGLSIALGFKARWGTTLLFLYLIPVTIIFHDFWNLEGADKMLQQIMFLKNLAIWGGLLYIISDGTGAVSIDHLVRKEHAKIPEKP